MKVSLNWVRDIDARYKSAAEPTPDGIEALIEKIGAQLGAIDEVVDLGKKYEGALIAKVVECVKHPNADKLSLCMVDVGKAKPVQVVCGAPNVKAGQFVVWLPPGATVPNTYDKDPFILEAREIRGQMSNGMIASARELALGDDHTGILVLEDGKPGQSFAQSYGLDDTVIDIENKMFTHRPDLFGMLGIAREIAGIQHQAFKSPAWYEQNADLHNDGRKNVLKLSVKNELPKLVPRFTAVAIKDVKIEESPVWLKIRLASVGIRPINNIVDLTNYFMMESSQPLHAYDYDKVKTGVLGVRPARAGEKVTVIGGKEVKLSDKTIVITDGDKAIGLGGVMGGAGTEVDKDTRNIILEVANFDMNVTRKTAMEYGLFTDAATRFTKNQSSHQQRAVLCKAVDDMRRIAGGRVASPIVDINHSGADKPPIKVNVNFINQRLGLSLKASQIKKLLSNVEFPVSGDERLTVKVPFWRTDIEIAEDIVEEVGRLYGYDHLNLSLPKRDIKAAGQDSSLAFNQMVRGHLATAGANEVLTYSFVHESLFKAAAQDKKQAFHIRNALSPDLQYYRLSLLPSLLEKIHPNIKLGFDEFALFEVGKSHNKLQKDETETDLPKEVRALALVYTSRDKVAKKGAAYFEAKCYLDYLAEALGFRLVYTPVEKESGYPATRPFEIARTAIVSDSATGQTLGMVGEFRQSLIDALKLPVHTAGFELDMSVLQRVAKSVKQYRPLNRFPSLDQDLCLRSDISKSYLQLTSFAEAQLKKAAALHGYEYDVRLLDIFQKAADKKNKQTTWRIKLWHAQRTLTTAEVNKLFDIIAGEAKNKLGAERI